MAQLGVLSEGELAPYLAGRYAMVGADVPGFNDFADSPVHRITPGIYMHAMALAVLAGCETMPKGMPSLPFLIQAAPVSPTAALPQPVARAWPDAVQDVLNQRARQCP